MILKTPQNLPPRLIQKIEAVQSEDEAYAADELVELGEEILSQLAAMGIAVYLQQEKQKEVYNDFLISLFLSNGHAYNAGPLYRWAANMLKDAEGAEAALLKPFFWQEKDGKEMLNEEIHHLASLRNAVMHGFFVLPPERNQEEAKKMEEILEKIAASDLFQKVFGRFHFIDKNGFNGHWNISDAKWWDSFKLSFSFDELAKRIAHEYSSSFNIEEDEIAFKNITIDNVIAQKVTGFLTEKKKGALVFWYNPSEINGINAYQSAIQSVSQEAFYTVKYTIQHKGASFTTRFLETEIGKCLFEQTGDANYLKDALKAYKKNRSKLEKKLVVVLHDVHIALFNPSHLLNLVNELYDLEIPLIAISWHYSFLTKYFNEQISLKGKPFIPTNIQLMESLTNFLRFKGPSYERAEEVAAFKKVEEIATKICSDLNEEKLIVARRFADENDFPIEYVHECFSIIEPFVAITNEQFEQDEVDELYGYPKEIKESSRIFLSLGRRDIKLEYQHKVIKV